MFQRKLNSKIKRLKHGVCMKRNCQMNYKHTERSTTKNILLVETYGMGIAILLPTIVKCAQWFLTTHSQRSATQHNICLESMWFDTFMSNIWLLNDIIVITRASLNAQLKLWCDLYEIKSTSIWFNQTYVFCRKFLFYPLAN